MMHAPNVLSARCPSRTLMNQATSKWGVLVLLALRGKTLRYSDLRRSIDGVSERMLAQTLKALEESGFLTRKAYKVVPPHVEYTLTDFGEGAAERVGALAAFLEESVAAGMRAGAAREQSPPAP